MASEKVKRQMRFIESCAEYGGVGTGCQQRANEWDHNPDAELIASGMADVFALRLHYTSGWDFSVKGDKLAKLYAYCGGNQFIPALAFQFKNPGHYWRVFSVTENTPAVAAGGLKLSPRQVQAAGTSLEDVIRGQTPTPLEDISYVDKFHQHRVPLTEQSRPAPDWATEYETQNETFYYEVPPEQDHYTLYLSEKDEAPQSAARVWSKEKQSGGVTYYANGPREMVVDYLRETGVLEPSESDITLAEAQARGV